MNPNEIIKREKVLEIIWNNSDRAVWEQVSLEAGRSALEQSWIYGEVVRDFYGMSVRRALLRSNESTFGVFQIFEKQFLGVAKVSRLVRGPIWEERHEEAMSVIARSFALVRR